MSAMEKDAKIYVAGHRGLVGSAIVRRLEAGGWHNLLTRTRAELDLTDRPAVLDFLASERPEYVFDAAARVGGIHANNEYPADFIRDNLLIQMNVIDGAHRAGSKKFLFLGSSCIYPKLAPQPMAEDSLLTGPLEPTNEWYAIAKIAGIKLCESYNRQYGRDYRSVMPTNLYGPGDNFHPENSHVLPALMRRFHEAQADRVEQVTIWGTGTPRREFMHVDDLASAAVHVMSLSKTSYDEVVPQRISHVNVGTGEDLSIAELAQAVATTTGYEGQLVFDTSKPDGTPRKLLDVSRLARLGWRARIGLQEGLESTYRWYQQHVASLREV